MGINTNGFLGHEINEISSSIQKKHYPYFSLFSNLNEFTAKVRKKIYIDDTNLVDLLATCLFIRIHESCQAAVLLLRNGLTTDAKVVIRSVFEALAHIMLLSKDENYAEQYVLASEFERSIKIKRLRKNPSNILAEHENKISPEEMAAFEETRMLLKDKKYITSQIASKAGLQDLYETVYSLFSDTVHVSSKSLERYLIFDSADEKVESFKWGPRQDNEIRDMLMLINSFIIDMLEAASVIFKFDFKDKFKPLVSEHIHLSKKT